VGARTGEDGVARLMFPVGTTMLDSIEVLPESGHWPAYAAEVAVDGQVRIACRPIVLSEGDARRWFGLEGDDEDGRGVKVAVIDSGVTEHADLCIARGVNVVRNEPAQDVADEMGHGTHVAGVIAGRGRPGSGVRGAAPAAALHAYRVFGRGEQTANSFYIAKAIRQAVNDGCDLINLSLGSQDEAPDMLREIRRAAAMGTVCVAASGNDYRASVAFPASYAETLAVSALGRIGTFPPGVSQELEIDTPFGADEADFIAAFSNIGPQIALTAPGMGIVSTYPGGYAVMDGTSMACPAATGAAARLLARTPEIRDMPRNARRTEKLLALARTAARSLGFEAGFEGAGLLI
jgi:subtilisin family serine protease